MGQGKPRLPIGPEVRYEESRLSREMVRRVASFLAGETTREALLQWARAVKPAPQHFRYGHADSLHTCLWNLDLTLGESGEPLVRRADLEEQLREVHTGSWQVEFEPVALLKLPIAEIVRRTGVSEFRHAIPGLGWFEKVRFASLGTGIGYLASCSLDVPHLRARGTSIHVYKPPASVAERTWLLGDLFDTLDIDATDATALWAPLTTRWNLLRQDDNGNKFLVDSFTGYAKAAARLDQLGAGHHKQIYWLEEVAVD